MDGPGLRIDLEEQDGWRCLAAHGEIDLATHKQVSQALNGLCSDGAKQVELDLRGVTFLDSMGLRVLIDAVAICKSFEAELRVRTNPIVHKLLSITGLLGILTLYAD